MSRFEDSLFGVYFLLLSYERRFCSVLAMKAKWTIIGATCVLVASLLQGCLVAAVGAGIGAAKYGSAKQREQYTNYRNAAEQTNLEREKAGLKPNKLLTYDEWRKGEEDSEDDKE